MPTAVERSHRERGRRRSDAAVAAMGPLGHLFASASAARMLSVFAAEPKARFTLGDLKQRAHAAKGTVQADLRRLMAAQLVCREGRGNKTCYRYALDREFGREMLRVVHLSRRQAQAEPSAAIPWLAGLAQRRPGSCSWNPFGEREEPRPSDEATQRVLEASEPLAEAEEPRTRPGLRTRR
jgi:hypothetical protein